MDEKLIIILNICIHFLTCSLNVSYSKAWKLIVMDMPFPINQTPSPSSKFMGDLIRTGCLSSLKFPSLIFLLTCCLKGIKFPSSLSWSLKVVSVLLHCIFVLLQCELGLVFLHYNHVVDLVLCSCVADFCCRPNLALLHWLFLILFTLCVLLVMKH